MNNKNIAMTRPYAKAAFEYALEHQVLNEWALFLNNLAQVFSSPEMAVLISHPSTNQKELVETLIAVFGADIKKEMGNFIRILAENKRLKWVGEVNEAYQALMLSQAHIVKATLVTAMPADEAFKKQVLEKLKQRFDREVELSCELDPSLIGGAIIRSGDWVLDGSLKGKLSRLSQTLMK